MRHPIRLIAGVLVVLGMVLLPGSSAVAVGPLPDLAGLLANLTRPNRNVHQPEDATISSFAYSPSGDGTVFAAGRNRQCALQLNCPAVLFRSNDGGASWVRLAARGFDGDKLLLPPAFPSGDRRIFVMSNLVGLQVSSDGGRTFRAAGVPPLVTGSADISPRFDSGDPRILIGTDTKSNLFQYRDDTKTISPAAYVPTPPPAFLEEPKFATPHLVIAGGQINVNSNWVPAVFRCAGLICSGTQVGDGAFTPKVRLLPDFATRGRMFAFTERELKYSSDGGATFTQVATPWADNTFDLALGRGGRNLFAAVWGIGNGGFVGGLYISRDGGVTWNASTNPLFDHGATVVTTSGRHVLAALSDGGLACSADRGVTWATRCRR